MTCTQCGTLNDNDRKDCVRCRARLRSVAMEGKIPCATHANREATTSCGSCGSRLCDTCAIDVNGVHFCENCAPVTVVRHQDEDYEAIPVLDPTVAVAASFGSRLFSLLVDSAIVFAGVVVLSMAVWILSGNLAFLTDPKVDRTGYYLFRAILILAIPAYPIFFTAMHGQTAGKQLSGIIVLQPDGKSVSLYQSVARTTATVLSILPLGLGFFWCLWDANHETWHDKIAGTRVFRYSEEL